MLSTFLFDLYGTIVLILVLLFVTKKKILVMHFRYGINISFLMVQRIFVLWIFKKIKNKIFNLSRYRLIIKYLGRTIVLSGSRIWSSPICYNIGEGQLLFVFKKEKLKPFFFSPMNHWLTFSLEGEGECSYVLKCRTHLHIIIFLKVSICFWRLPIQEQWAQEHMKMPYVNGFFFFFFSFFGLCFDFEFDLFYRIICIMLVLCFLATCDAFLGFTFGHVWGWSLDWYLHFLGTCLIPISFIYVLILRLRFACHMFAYGAY